jgi:hypothetical protein
MEVNSQLQVPDALHSEEKTAIPAGKETKPVCAVKKTNSFSLVGNPTRFSIVQPTS